MSTSVTEDNRRLKRANPARSGGVSIVVLLAVPTLMACVALALDIAMVSYQTRQMQTACDAAALAGAVELMDRTPLYRESLLQANLAIDPSAWDAQLAEEQIDTARKMARTYAAHNAVASNALLLEANRANRPDGDLVVGWVEEPQRRDVPLQVWSGDGPVNSLLVRGNRWEERGNAVTYWIGRLFGLADVDLSAAARATIDCRVYGFRPSGHVPVPLMPIVIHPSDSVSNDRDERANEQISEPVDRYAIDDRTGVVVAGSDGICEFVLTIPDGQLPKKCSNASLVNFEIGPPREIDMQRRIERGCNASDLQDLGGEISCYGGLDLPIIELARDVSAAAVTQSLLVVQGEKRIWLLGECGQKETMIQGCVAGRVAACAETATGLEIVVQPCLLITCNALVGKDGAQNPWIGKLTLSE